MFSEERVHVFTLTTLVALHICPPTKHFFRTFVVHAGVSTSHFHNTLSARPTSLDVHFDFLLLRCSFNSENLVHSLTFS